MHHPAFSFVADQPIRGASDRRLSGWRIPVKDSTDIAGWPTTHGSPLRAHTARRTDPIVQMLIDAGATVPAKTLTSELGATCYAERPDVPVLESPAFPGCTPGGSSTGAGVAVDLGLVRAAHGTDAGGSVRVPAAACGVVGLKLGGESLAAHGFLARSVEDLFTLTGWQRPAMDAAPRRLRIGVLTEGLFADPQVQGTRGTAVEEAAALLGRHHDVVALRPYSGAKETYEHFSTAIKLAFLDADPLDSAYIGWLHEEAQRITPAQRAAAAAHRASLAARVAGAWGVDILCSPTLAFDPPRLGYFPALAPEESFHAQTEWSPWCSLFNMLQLPAVALGPVHLGALTVDGAELLHAASLVAE